MTFPRIHTILCVALLGVGAHLTGAKPAQANEISSCTLGVDPKCSNSCDLLDYFQFIYKSPARPHNCKNIPAEFWVYQTQVGNVASGGKSSGSSAAAAGSSSANAGSAAAGAVTMTPSSAITAGAMALRYVPEAKPAEGSKIIYEQMDGDFSDLPPLEKRVWVKLLGTFGRKNSTPELASVKLESNGIMSGFDLYSDEYFRLGVLGSISDISVEINENDNKFDATVLKGGVTATLEIDKWYLDGLGTYSRERNKTSRTVDIDGNGDLRPMWSRYTNERIGAAFETGFRFSAGRVIVQPLAGVNINWLKQARVMEQGNISAAILTTKNTIMTGNTKLGMNLSTAFVGHGFSIVPTIGGYWSHRFGELENANRISTTLGTTYEYVGEKPPLDVINLQASLMANLGPKFALSAHYNAAFNRLERNHSVNLGMQLRY